MLVVEPSLRANIYDILSYVTTTILGVPCPITNVCIIHFINIWENIYIYNIKYI